MQSQEETYYMYIYVYIVVLFQLDLCATSLALFCHRAAGCFHEHFATVQVNCGIVDILDCFDQSCLLQRLCILPPRSQSMSRLLKDYLSVWNLPLPLI